MPLGIIPSGTGNDTARTLGLPFDPVAATHVVAAGLVHAVDLGRLTQGDKQRYFASIACAGIDSLVNDRANSLPWPKGKARYNLAMAIELLKYRRIPVRLELAGGTVLEDTITVFAIGHTRSYGGGVQVCPFACLQDGLFDITFIPRIPRLKVARHVRGFLKGDFRKLAEARSFRATRVEIEVPGLNIYADGEGRFHSSAVAEIIPQAARFIVPKPLCEKAA